MASSTAKLHAAAEPPRWGLNSSRPELWRTRCRTSLMRTRGWVGPEQMVVLGSESKGVCAPGLGGRLKRKREKVRPEGKTLSVSGWKNGVAERNGGRLGKLVWGGNWAPALTGSDPLLVKLPPRVPAEWASGGVGLELWGCAWPHGSVSRFSVTRYEPWARLCAGDAETEKAPTPP